MNEKEELLQVLELLLPLLLKKEECKMRNWAAAHELVTLWEFN